MKFLYPGGLAKFLMKFLRNFNVQLLCTEWPIRTQSRTRRVCPELPPPRTPRTPKWASAPSLTTLKPYFFVEISETHTNYWGYYFTSLFRENQSKSQIPGKTTPSFPTSATSATTRHQKMRKWMFDGIWYTTNDKHLVTC